jgi:DivIVA domain-containing protein
MGVTSTDMELSPQSVAQTTFKTVKKGYDPDEVRAYLARLATAIEATQTQAAAMEARARAAVARLQELAGQPTAPTPMRAPEPIAAPTAPAPVAERDTTSEDAQTISRTLLLAQRTADATIAEANAEAKKIRDEADAVARHALDSAKEVQARLVEEARAEVRRASEDQRVQIDSEVQSLLARREFLLSDVEHLEQHVISHRDRIREVAASLTTIVEGTGGGLADLRRPLMSAAGEDSDAPALAPTMPLGRVPTLAPATDEPAAENAAAPDTDNTVDDSSDSSDAGDDSDDSDDSNDTGDGTNAASESEPATLPLGDTTPAAGYPAANGEPDDTEPDDTEPTQVVPTVPRLGNDLFRVSGDELR